jgi:vitamin B12 transporter
MSIGFRDLLFAGATLACLAPVAARAADAATAEVEELVVTGQLEQTLPAKIAETGSRLVTIDGETVRKGLYVDVGQALAAEVPGLSLIPQAGPFSYNNASLQGSRREEILYLVDGVRISNRLYNGTPPLDTVPAHLVERIEQLEGGQSLFFGTQGVGGVINIVTRGFSEDISGRLEVGGDTNEAFTASGYLTRSFGAHHLLAFASQDQSEGYSVFDKDEYQPSGTDRHRGYRMTSVGGKYGYDFSDTLKFTASLSHTEGYAELPRPNLVTDARNARNDDIAYAKLDWDVSEDFSLYVKGYWHSWRSHYDQTNNTPTGPVVVDDHEIWRFHDKGVNVLGRYVIQPGLELWGGYDLQRYGGKDDVLIIAEQNETAHAVFAQLRVGPEMLPRTHLSAGVRHTFTKFTEDATVFAASGKFDVTDHLFVSAVGGTSFRLPDAESLFSQDPMNNGEIGNPDLKPERARNLNASIGAQGEGWKVELVGFYRRTKDLISLDGETPDPDVFQFINLPDKVTGKGVELVATWAPVDWMTWNGAYTHARTKQSGSSAQLGNIVKDYARLAIDLHPVDAAYGGGATLNWVGDVYDDLPSGLGRLNRGNYAVVDLTAWYDLGDRGRLSAKLENALDDNYTVLERRFFKDVGGAAYVGHFRGVPRTLHVAYSYSF